MEKYKRLFNNSVLFTVGSLGSKIISFVMVPIYTYILTTNEYGIVDLITVTVSLLVPFMTLELGQSALRFTIEAKTKNQIDKIFSILITQGLLVSLLLFILLPFFLKINVFSEYTLYFILLLILNVFNNLLSQFVRGIGKVKEFAINGILMTIVTVTFNILFLVVMDYGVIGYLLSIIFAAIISNLYLLFSVKGFKRFTKFTYDRFLLKEMLKYSVPIIPNSSMWWIVNSSSRYLILYFLGSSANGVFAVANKIPSLIPLMSEIFIQAWQLSSFEEFDKNDKNSKNNFYSNIFNIYSTFLFISGSGLLLVLQPVILNFVDSSYNLSWKIAPFLILAAIYQSFGSFYGTTYAAAKQTSGAFRSSSIAAVISLISNLIFLPLLGIIGAGMAVLFGFVSMFLIRVFGTKKYVTIKLGRKFYISNVILAIQIFGLFLFNGFGLLIVQSLLFSCLILANNRILIKIAKIFLKYFKKR